jgi:hypothetical protein
VTKLQTQAEISQQQKSICHQLSKTVVQLVIECPEHFETTQELFSSWPHKLDIFKQICLTFKGTTYLHNYTVLVFNKMNAALLPVFNLLIKNLEDNKFAVLTKPGRFVDVIVPHLNTPATVETALEIISNVAITSSTWIYQLLSLFISGVQMAEAENTSLAGN